jgi:hypothetical protein
MLFTHALVPSAFRLQVSAMIQESPSKFFLTASGILKPRHAAHRNKTPTAGSAIRHQARRAGKSSPNGSGTSVWSWAISCILIRCVPPSLLLLSHLRTRSPPRRLLFRGTGRQKSLCPGKLAASQGKTLPSNRMGLCVVQQANHWWHMSSAGKPMAACAWSMQPVSVVAVLVLCESLANGKAAPPKSRAR